MAQLQQSDNILPATHIRTQMHTLCRQDRVKHFPWWWHNTCFHFLLKRPHLWKPHKLKLFLSWTFSFLHNSKTPTFVQAVQTTVTPSGVLLTASFFFPKQHHISVSGAKCCPICGICRRIGPWDKIINTEWSLMWWQRLLTGLYMCTLITIVWA